MVRTLALRRLTPVALLASAALVLASCGDDDNDASGDASPSSSPSSSESADAGGCGEYSSGDTSAAVKVTGEFGEKQEADFKTPLEATKLERTVLDEGTGEDTVAGEPVDVLLSLYLGKDGTAIGTEPASITVGDPQIPDAFTAGVDCVPIGSRVVVSAAAAEVYGEQGNPNLGIAADDSLVIVTDVIGAKEPVTPKAWKEGAPKVTFDADGKPTLKLPSSKPPAELLLKVLRAGDGDVVKSGDTVTLDYQGTSWDTGEIFDQSYGMQPATFATTGVVEGFGAALVGQKVGTRLVVSIPPQYAYGEAGSGHELAGQTLVFVIEIQETATQ